MLTTFVDFFNLLLAALLVGTIFGTWLTASPANLGVSDYIVVQHQHIRALNVFMPLLGGATILLSIASALLSRADGTRLTLMVFVVLSFIIAGLITRFLNQPINAVVMTWKPDAPPVDWMQLRDVWWRWHLVRLTFGLFGLCLLIAAMLKRHIIGD